MVASGAPWESGVVSCRCGGRQAWRRNARGSPGSGRCRAIGVDSASARVFVCQEPRARGGACTPRGGPHRLWMAATLPRPSCLPSVCSRWSSATASVVEGAVSGREVPAGSGDGGRRRAPCSLGLRPRCAWRAAMSAAIPGVGRTRPRYNGINRLAGNGSAKGGPHTEFLTHSGRSLGSNKFVVAWTGVGSGAGVTLAKVSRGSLLANGLTPRRLKLLRRL